MAKLPPEIAFSFCGPVGTFVSLCQMVSILRRRRANRCETFAACHEIGTAECGTLYNHRSFADMRSWRLGFQVQLIEFFDQEGVFHSNHWDVSKGLVQRTLLV